MKLSVTRQESYSRGELLLRTLFGWIYIMIPHGFLLFFVGIWSAILAFVTFWAVLFTGKLPEGIYNFTLGAVRWGNRLTAWSFSLTDQYPPFSLST